jgi:hypothetical protein
VGWTCDTAHTVCALDADAVAYLTVLLQGVWFAAGALLGVAVVLAATVFFRRV